MGIRYRSGDGIGGRGEVVEVRGRGGGEGGECGCMVGVRGRGGVFVGQKVVALWGVKWRGGRGVGRGVLGCSIGWDVEVGSWARVLG